MKKQTKSILRILTKVFNTKPCKNTVPSKFVEKIKKVFKINYQTSLKMNKYISLTSLREINKTNRIFQ